MVASKLLTLLGERLVFLCPSNGCCGNGRVCRVDVQRDYGWRKRGQESGLSSEPGCEMRWIFGGGGPGNGCWERYVSARSIASSVGWLKGWLHACGAQMGNSRGE